MITLLSTSDTDLLSAQAATHTEDVHYQYANPNLLTEQTLAQLVDTTDVFVVRLLGGKRAWEWGLDALLASKKPLVVVSGELAVDAELTDLSTMPAGVVTTAHTYLAEGGKQNLVNLHNFLSDTVLLTGLGFEAPSHMPIWGHLEDGVWDAGADAPRVGIVYYRAQHLAGNTNYVHALADALVARGATAVPIFAASLRQAEPELLAELATCDALITTVLAAGMMRRGMLRSSPHWTFQLSRGWP